MASLTTAMSVGLPRPDRSKTADTIFLYKLSSSSRVRARLSVISLSTGCKRDSNTRLCSSRKSAERKKQNDRLKVEYSLNKPVCHDVTCLFITQTTGITESNRISLWHMYLQGRIILLR